MSYRSQSHRLEEVIKQFARTDPAALAVVSPKYHPLSYTQLADQIDHVAESLTQSGFDRSSRIAIAIKDNALAALAIVTIACSAVAVPLDQNLAEAEIETRLKLLEVDAVFGLSGEITAAKTAAEKCGIPFVELMPNDKGKLGFSLSVLQVARKADIDDLAIDTVAVIFQTSGTTAEPKLVPCLHSNLLATAQNARGWFHLDQHDRCLSIAPPYYSHGLTLTILTPLLSGGSVAFPSSLTQPNLSEWFELLSPTWFSASPTMHLVISEMLESDSSSLKHHVRLASSGGAKLPESLRLKLEVQLGIQMLEHYGMTEASQVSSNLPPPGPKKPDTLGVPPAETIMIAGPDGNGLPQGETGEVLVRGPNVIKGYLKNPELNQAAFRDGWFRTGDLGSFDQEGFLQISGRIKEFINRGGEKISPFEIEAVLIKHPNVLEAVAFAVPHPRLGEDVSAVVVLRPGATVAAGDFRRFMGAQLSWSKVPRRVHIIESIPKGSGGKVLRNKLSEIYS
ncbi:MAG: AMP-binding protein [Smithella sp.]